MRKMTLFLIGFLLAASTYAQIEITRPVEEYSFNKKTIVNNERGKRYTYANWSKLLATGNYTLKPVHHDSDSTEFILTKRDKAAENMLLARMPKPVETKFFKTGDLFRFKKVTDMEGNTILPEDLSGKIVVINFWFIACPPCRYEMPELNKVVKAYESDKDIVFIAVTLDKKSNVQRFLRVSPFNYHVVSDSMPLFRYYGVDECPASLVIDRKGIIRFNSQGYGDGNVPYWIEKTIEQVKIKDEN